MTFLWNTVLKDLRRHRRNPTEFLLWIGIPLLIGALIIMAAGGKGGPEPLAHLLVTDEDQSFLSGFLVGGLSQDALGDVIRAETVTQQEGRTRMAKGQASALLIIPAGFGQAVLREQPVTLQLLTNPAQRVLPGIIEESLGMLSEGVFYLQRLIGDDLRAFADGPPAGRNTFSDPLIAGFSVRINHIIDRISSYLDPLVIQLETIETAEAETDFGFSEFALYFMPGILFMGLLFMSQGLGDDLWKERDQRTLRRVVVSPQRVTAFLAGKLIAGACLMCVVCLAGLCAGYLYFGLNALSFPLALAWATFSGVMFLLLLLQIQLWAASQRAGNIITLTVIFPLMMVGGSFFPFSAMPDWMATVGRHTPNGWALQQLQDILLLRIDLLVIARGFLVLLAVIALLFLLSARRLQRGFAQG
jgi:ABC-type multidrug transport system permease subunit